MFTIAFLGLAFADPEKRDIIIPVDGSPFEVEVFGVGIDSKDDLTVSVYVKNTSKETIEAVEVGFAFYDYFNEFVYGFRGFSKLLNAKTELKSGEQTLVQFSPRFRKSAFVLTSTSFATRARFAGGKIWIGNLDEVTKKIKQLAGVNFDPAKLEP